MLGKSSSKMIRRGFALDDWEWEGKVELVTENILWQLDAQLRKASNFENKASVSDE